MKMLLVEFPLYAESLGWLTTLITFTNKLLSYYALGTLIERESLVDDVATKI